MDKVEMSSKLREVFGRKVDAFRKKGLVPAVVYGKGMDAKSIWVNDLDLRRMLKNVGESAIIELSLEGQEKVNVLIHEIQRDPVKNIFQHVDFYKVRMDEKIETGVPLEFLGESPAVKELGGVLVKSLDEVEVSCLPADLPSEIAVDISTIKNFEDRITIADLKVSSKVEIKADPETVVATVAPPRTEEELSSLEEKVEADVSKVEGVVKEEAVAEGKSEEKKEEK